MGKVTEMTFKSSIVTEFKSSTAIKSVDDIPVGNKKSYDVLFSNDSIKHEFISITMLGEKYPAELDRWTDIVLTEEWAASFAEQVNKVPKPVFIPGHKETGIGIKERAIPDGYLVGASVKGDTLYLRNSLPEGETPEQKALISQTLKEISAKMLSTSLTDVMEYDIVVNDSDYTETYFAMKSLKGQTNALVEADQTGSEAEIIITSFKSSNDLDEEQGENRMSEKITNVELFISLKNQLDSGKLAFSEIAEKLGIDLMTAKQKLALKRLNDVESKVGSIDEFVASVVSDREATFTALKEASIKDRFKDEELIEIATPLFALKEGNAEAITGEVDRLAELKMFKTIQGKLAGSVSFKPAAATSDEENASIPEVMEG